MLLLGVDDPDSAGDLRHLADTTESLGQLVLLPLEDKEFLLGQARAGDIVVVDELEFLEPLKTLVDRAEVGEHATEPTLVDVGHPYAGGLLGDRLLRLLLGTDEHDRTTVRNRLFDELVGAVDVGQ